MMKLKLVGYGKDEAHALLYENENGKQILVMKSTAIEFDDYIEFYDTKSGVKLEDTPETKEIKELIIDLLFDKK